MLKSMYSRVWCEVHSTNQIKSSSDVDDEQQDNSSSTVVVDVAIGIAVVALVLCVVITWYNIINS